MRAFGSKEGVRQERGSMILVKAGFVYGMRDLAGVFLVSFLNALDVNLGRSTGRAHASSPQGRVGALYLPLCVAAALLSFCHHFSCPHLCCRGYVMLLPFLMLLSPCYFLHATVVSPCYFFHAAVVSPCYFLHATVVSPCYFLHAALHYFPCLFIKRRRCSC